MYIILWWNVFLDSVIQLNEKVEIVVFMLSKSLTSRRFELRRQKYLIHIISIHGNSITIGECFVILFSPLNF